MFKNTLVSLAVIRTLANQQNDFLDFILPFTQDAVASIESSEFTAEDVATHISTNYGIFLPERTIELSLKRLAKKDIVKKEKDKYTYIEIHRTIDISSKINEANAIIDDVIANIVDFSKNETGRECTNDDVISAILSFLSLFSIDCLHTFHRNSVLPMGLKLENPDWELLLISAYIKHVQERDEVYLEKFMVIVYGHMLAASLLCPDLKENTKTYNKTKFFFDTSNIISFLGLHGKYSKDAIDLLFKQLINLGGIICCFTHTIEEVKNVITNSAPYIDKDDGEGGIVIEARSRKWQPADLLLFVNTVDEIIDKSVIEIVRTPEYSSKHQIDEKQFENYLDENLKYRNPYAKKFDINSLRCIFELRKNENPVSIEKSKAIFVTDNIPFANAACKYSFSVEESIISPVINRHSLANVAWLKSPMKSPLLPAKEIIAFAYASLNPSKEFWKKVLEQAEHLQRENKISINDLCILRAAPSAKEKVIIETLGDTDKISFDSLTSALQYAIAEIKKEHITDTSDLENRLKNSEDERKKLKEGMDASLQKTVDWSIGSSKSWASKIYILICLIIAITVWFSFDKENSQALFNMIGLSNDSYAWILCVSENLKIIFAIVVGILGFRFSSLRDKIDSYLYPKILIKEALRRGIDPKKITF